MIENKKIKHDMRHALTMVEMCTNVFQGEYANTDTYTLILMQVFKIMSRLKYHAARLFY